MQNNQEINIHLICDSTGEVLGSISRFVSSMFLNAKIKEYFWYLTKTQRQIDDIVNIIKKMQDDKTTDGVAKKTSIVICSFTEGSLELYLNEKCKENNIAIKSATKSIVNFVGQFCSENNSDKDINKDSKFNDNYFQRIAAVEYTISHDDGNLSGDLDEADILLIGPSRTSKTPVSVYLGYMGFKVANIPFVDESFFDVPYLKSLQNTLIVGLTINPQRLEDVRKTRLQQISSQYTNTNYTDIDKINEEVKLSKRLYAKLDCFVIDVTQKSVEETSAYILTLHNKLFTNKL